MTELTKKCLSLNRSYRERLVKILQESLNKPELWDDAKFKVLYEVATEMFGNGILTSSRNYELTLGRRFIAYQMVQDGYPYYAVGKYLIRHHSSVMHMCRMMEDTLKYQFKPEIMYWNQFQKKIKEHDKTREIQTNSCSDSQAI